ncbi:uncharacterized protein [Argopecten irradians]|uniref:uncharacterized protein n=1 Tax=Argopecten irradians TaxID=31199 RepID=UPI0037167726
MAGVDYCTVLPSWEFDKDPACIVSYQFDSIDGSLEAIGTDYIPPNSLMDSCLTLECPGNDQVTGDSREACTLSITCKPQYRVSVLGLDIASQSRSLEVYDACEGYLCTSRGKRVPCMDAEGGENQSDVFTCRVRLRETVFGFTVKFPSTSNMKQFNIYNMVLILNPEAEDTTEVTPTFNMDKVKSFLDPDTLSPGAQHLMQSVEQFQQNKKSTVSGLQGMLGSSSSRSAGSSRPGMMGLMGLMSMFSSVPSQRSSSSRGTGTGTTQSTGSDPQCAASNTTQICQRDSMGTHEATHQTALRDGPQKVTELEANLQQTVTSQMRETNTTAPQANPLEAMTSSLHLLGLGNSGSSHQGTTSGVPEQGQMYQMLQNICGSVSQMRTTPEDVGSGGTNTGAYHGQGETIQSGMSGDTGEQEGQMAQDKASGGQKYTPDSIRTVVKSCIEEFELRLQTHIDNRLSLIEQKLDAKLDRITQVLQSLTRAKSNADIYNQTSSTSCPLPSQDLTYIPTGNHNIPTEDAISMPTHNHTLPIEGATSLPTHDHTLPIEGATPMPTHNYTLPTDGATSIPTHNHYSPKEGATSMPTHNYTSPTEGATSIPTHNHYSPKEGATSMPTHNYTSPTEGATSIPTHNHYSPKEGATSMPTHNYTTPTEGATSIPTHNHYSPTEGTTFKPTDSYTTSTERVASMPLHSNTDAATHDVPDDRAFVDTQDIKITLKNTRKNTHDNGNEDRNGESITHILEETGQQHHNKVVMDDESGENS